MKIIDIVNNLDMDVDFYAKALYSWQKHNDEEKQTISDVNKPGGFLKILKGSNENRAYVLKSRSQDTLPLEIKREYTLSSQELMLKLLGKEFYFFGIIKRNCSFEEIYFPDFIYSNLEDAYQGASEYLSNI